MIGNFLLGVYKCVYMCESVDLGQLVYLLKKQRRLVFSLPCLLVAVLVCELSVVCVGAFLVASALAAPKTIISPC